MKATLIEKILTQKAFDEILDETCDASNNYIKDRNVQDIYRYLLKHSELQESESGRLALKFTSDKVVQIWCQETNTSDEVWIRSFVSKVFGDQIRKTPDYAERGKDYAECLLRQIELYLSLK